MYHIALYLTSCGRYGAAHWGSIKVLDVQVIRSACCNWRCVDIRTCAAMD